MAEMSLFDEKNEQFTMPNAENGVEAIGQVNIKDSIDRDKISSRLIKHVQEDLQLPNLVIDLRGKSGLKVSPYCVKALESVEREKGDLTVYLATDRTIEKLMRTDYKLKEVVFAGVRDLIHPDIKVYEDVVIGQKLKVVNGGSIKNMRLNL